MKKEKEERKQEINIINEMNHNVVKLSKIWQDEGNVRDRRMEYQGRDNAR